MTATQKLLAFASLLAGASACFNDKGPQEDTVDATTGAGETAATGTSAEGNSETGDPGDPALVGLCTSDLTRKDAIASEQCQCQVDQGMFTDVAACLAQSGAKPSTPACTCEIYGAHPETRAGLECAAPAQEALLACLADVSCVQDTTAYNACTDPYYNAISTCGAPAKSLTSQIAIECEMIAPFVCGSGEAVPETWTCDLKADCKDGSDEKDCAGSFMCDDGKFIDEGLKCDEFPDCADESDEQNCPSFMCVNGTVILLTYKCDGIPDCCPGVEDPQTCADKSDEANCPTFKCDSGMTIPLMYLCDGIEDCDDKSDEIGCPP